MTPPLPPKPSLTQLKNRAKTLRKTHASGDAAACETLRGLQRFIGKSDEDILAAEVSLAEAQHAVAIDHGFKNWRELKAHIENVTRPSAPARQGGITIPEYKGEPIDLAAHGIKYGFRYDPMEFVEDGQELEAALVRKHVFGQSPPEEQEALDQHVDDFIARSQQGDGPSSYDILSLFACGSPALTPKVREVLDDIVRKALNEDGQVGPYALYAIEALCGLAEDDPTVAEVVLATIREEAKWVRSADWEGDPLTPARQLKALWVARGFGEVDDAIETGLNWIAEAINEIGRVRSRDPIGLLDLAGTIHHPVGLEIALKHIPTILRFQRPDGSWNGDTPVPGWWETAVLRALVRYGLLDPLRQLPPLPADWTIVRSVPAPNEPELHSLTWGGALLWTSACQSNLLLAISPEDGAVVKRLTVPDQCRDEWGLWLGWWDDCPALMARGHRTLYQLDPDTGAVRRALAVRGPDQPCGFVQTGRQLWVADASEWHAWVYDLQGEPLGCVVLAQPTGHAGTTMAWTGDGIWHCEGSLPLLVKSSTDTQLVPENDPRLLQRQASLQDFGEKPFGGDTLGIAWDGKNLWALDSRNKRICIIEKTESGNELTASLAAAE